VTTDTSPPPLPARADPLVVFDVRESVIAAIAGHAAASVAGVTRMEQGLYGLVASATRTVRQRMAGVDSAPAQGVRVVADGGRVWLEVAVTVSGQDQAAATGQAVQRAVARAVRESTGYPVAGVTVSILDVDLAVGRLQAAEEAT
jgi:uncharacterized alkaline shock family protein YloU